MAKRNISKRKTKKMKNLKGKRLLKDIEEKTRTKKAKNLNKMEKNKKVNKKIKLQKKKVAVPFYKLKRIFTNENINKFSLEELKVNASIFDLNPLINYKLLSILKKVEKKEYNKYISKYKFTLDYEDAKKLKCFKNKEEDIKKEIQKNFGVIIVEIKSLSKLKLFNFLFYLLNIKDSKDRIAYDYENFIKEIRSKIESYSCNEDLIFKAPNNYGNYELQYYTYLELFTIYFAKNLKFESKEDENKNKNETKEEIFFDWTIEPEGEIEEVDLRNIDKNIEQLNKEIKDFINKKEEIKKKNNKQIKEKKNKKIRKENNILNSDKNKSNKEASIKKILNAFFEEHVAKLKKFKNELFYLFKEKDDSKIIQNIEFIYFNLLFTKNNFHLYDSYPNCLLYDPTTKNENHKLNYFSYTSEEIRKSIKEEELVFCNLDNNFEDKKDNPFSNNAKYFKYPILLEKNIFQLNKKHLTILRNFLKKFIDLNC